MTVAGFFEGTEMPTAGWWEALWPDPAGVLASVGLPAGADAVDLCCGDGWFTLHMARTARRVLAVDIDAGLLALARRRLAEHGMTNCSLVESDAYALPDLARQRDGQRADFVFLANAFHGVPDRPRLAAAVKAALSPGGRCAIVNWHKRPREETIILGEPRGPRTELRLSPDETIRSVEAGGLKLQRLVEVPPYHYAAVFGRP
jgi:SAM-dependent methyltransferase